ncbi:MAG TPA: glycoside hydrolase family 2 TIM barrel-domain containing protein [Candidatus Sulfopaludibacter sp.]|nr:glycoside hydrolase family 2 TIM barrel-domain containing protein [Candidatus Sulfopaludibacter sp.]
MKTLNRIPAAAVLAVLPALCAAPVRERRNFDEAWRFEKGDPKGAEQPGFDDRAWRKLTLPHDWSIEGPYSASNASGTGYLPGGVGWYRKAFPLAEPLRAGKVFLDFDGVYRDSDVWINGHHLGHRPYGYSSFEYDLTPYLNFGARTNVVAVRVDHSEFADSRFYTGSGIYRHVWLVATQPVHVAHWGSYVYTPVVRDAEATVTIETAAINESKAAATVRLATSIEDDSGHEIASAASEEKMAAGESRTFVQQAAVKNPALWSTEAPRLYTAVTRIFADGAPADEYRTPFGIRTLRFDPNHGFFLNGKPEKFKGVCLHHDLGALGAAFSEAALERRLKLLKEIGVNAIRCSHNPMAPEQYDLCDRLGLLVMDESFDEWTGGKHKWIQGWNQGKPGTDGYHEAFAEWSRRDIQDMVLRDRNHPSVVMWSIGNEIDYPGDPFGYPLDRGGIKPGMPNADVLPSVARRLIGAVKELDGTRPVTQALANTVASNATGLADLLDVAGYNYLEQHYAEDHAAHPGRIILGSENFHTLPAWRAVAANEYVLGQFLWTGIDYLGESRQYPARGSTSGLLDWCGFRKPMSYLREALWSDRPMVYAAALETRQSSAAQTDFETSPARGRLVEHWNFANDARKTIPVEVYTNLPTADLFLNGRSLGGKNVTDPVQPVLRWEVPNEPGVVRAIGKRDGKEAAHFDLATAGAPDRIELIADRTALRAGGADLANLEIRVVDAQGRRVFNAAQPIQVEVRGAGELAAMDSANVRDVTPVQAGHRNAFEGRVLAIIRAGAAAGKVTVVATAPGLKQAQADLVVE